MVCNGVRERAHAHTYMLAAIGGMLIACDQTLLPRWATAYVADCMAVKNSLPPTSNCVICVRYLIYNIGNNKSKSKLVIFHP